MKNKVFCLFIVLVLSTLAFSVPFTTLGEMKVPSAYVLPNKMVQAAYTSYFASESTESDYLYDYAFNMNFGVYNRLEVGVVATKNDVIYGNMKIQLINEKRNIPAICVGMDNIASKVTDEKTYGLIDADDYEANSLYMVFSKTALLRGLPFVNYLETTMHFGMGRKRFFGQTEFSQQVGGMFGSLIFRPNQYLSIITEMDGYNINLGFSASYSKFSLKTGIYRVEELDRQDLKIAMNLTYSFDVFSEKKYEETRPSFSVGRRVIVNDPEVVNENSQPDNNPILEELKQIRQRRKDSEKELEEIKKMLEEE